MPAVARVAALKLRLPCVARCRLSDHAREDNRGLCRFSRLRGTGDLQIGPTADWRPTLPGLVEYRSSANRAPTFACRCRTRAASRFDRRKIPIGTATAHATNRDREFLRGRRTVHEW